MYEVRHTDVFAKWLEGLKDAKAKARILVRLESVRLGNLGDVKAVGGGLRELRIHVGPGYRIYFKQQNEFVLVLLCGGNKSTQSRDVRRAQYLLKQLEKQ